MVVSFAAHGAWQPRPQPGPSPWPTPAVPRFAAASKLSPLAREPFSRPATTREAVCEPRSARRLGVPVSRSRELLAWLSPAS